MAEETDLAGDQKGGPPSADTPDPAPAPPDSPAAAIPTDAEVVAVTIGEDGAGTAIVPDFAVFVSLPDTPPAGVTVWADDTPGVAGTTTLHVTGAQPGTTIDVHVRSTRGDQP